MAATLLDMMRLQRRATAPEPPSWVEPRGVYWAKHLIEGRRVAYAVDSRGEVIKRLRVHPNASPDEAIAYLWECLDTRDPVSTPPRLRVLRSG